MGLGLPARPHLGCVASRKWLSPRAGGATGRTAPSGELGPLLRLFRGRRSCLWGPELRGTGPGGQPEPRGSGDLGSRLPDWTPKAGVGQACAGPPFPPRSMSTPGQAIASVPGAVAWTPPLLLHRRTPQREALAPLTPQGWIRKTQSASVLAGLRWGPEPRVWGREALNSEGGPWLF